MKLDFSDVKENKIVAEGKNELTIVAAKEQTSANGTSMLVIDMHDTEGGFIRDNVCLEGAGAFRAQQLFKALGLSSEDASSMEASDLIGMSVIAEVAHEEYNNEQRAKIKKYFGA